MKSLLTLSVLLLLCVSSAVVSIHAANHGFIQCMSTKLTTNNSTEIICPSGSCDRYSGLLLSSEQNPRWVDDTSKPLYIVTPSHESHVQASIVCSKNNGLRIRVRSGGHDFEGLSYRCDSRFVLIDLKNFRSIEVDVEEETAWVQSGATIGELYYEIAKKSGIHGFPAGICPSVGVGGHFSGGGIGPMMRKHGVAADRIVDARVVDSNGRILDRRSMGEDLFWAIRGGGAASFGVVLSWKVELVKVPATVTVFTVSRPLDEPSSISLTHYWQYVADKLPEDLFILLLVWRIGNKPQVQFKSLFLGEAGELIRVMDRRFPELGVTSKDCIETSWIESVVYFAGNEVGDPPEMLLDRVTRDKCSFKGKCDFVERPMPKTGFRKIWEFVEEEELGLVVIQPFGGRMSEISASEIAFPHRKGNRYEMLYLARWGPDEKEPERHFERVRRLYERMTPYVSRSPRTAYVNYRDLDLGTNEGGNESYHKPSVWGKQYFGDNFERLVRVKTTVDPNDFFRNEQSIPSDPKLWSMNKYNNTK